MESVPDILLAMRRKKIRLWAEDGQLRYEAPGGVLSAEDRATLRVWRSRIINYLRESPAYDIPVRLAPQEQRCPTAPFSCSQQWWWNSFGFTSTQSVRTVTSAKIFHGKLNVDLMMRSFASISERHESLRTRILMGPTGPYQYIDKAGADMQFLNVSRTSSAESEHEARSRLQDWVGESFDISRGPPIAARLVMLGHSQFIIAVALDHIIADAASLSILWRDLLASYRASLTGNICVLPDLPIQLSDYAHWQKTTQQPWSESHGTYWTGRLAGAAVAQLPAKPAATQAAPVRWGMSRFSLSATLVLQLRDVARREHTTLVLVVYTAYAATLASCCGLRDMVVPFEIAGRHRQELKNTIGMFVAPLLLRIEQHTGDRLLDLLLRVTQEYKRACEHDESGRVAADPQFLELTRNPHFNWVPCEFNAESAPTEQTMEAGNLRIAPYSIEDPESQATRIADYFGARVCRDMNMRFEAAPDHSVTGLAFYRADLCVASVIERFVANLHCCLRALASEPTLRVSEVAFEW